MAVPQAKHVTVRHYAWTYALVIALATLSLGLTLADVHSGIAVALAIAFVKAFLVLGWFMHLVEESFGFKLVMLISTLLVLVLIALTVLDPLTRTPYPPPPADNHEYRAGAR